MKNRLQWMLVFSMVCSFAVSIMHAEEHRKHAEEHGKLIFEDNFERNVSQELKDEVGKGWGTNSKSRAQGNKQVDLRDGAMYIYIHEAADHAVSVTHEAEFQDGSVELRFMLENDHDTLGLNFADLHLDIQGDTVNVAIDGEDVSSFTSEGFSHPTKKMLRLSVPKPAVVDDVKIFAATK